MFNKKHKKVISIIWSVLAVLIAISMVLLYAPALYQ